MEVEPLIPMGHVYDEMDRLDREGERFFRGLVNGMFLALILWAIMALVGLGLIVLVLRTFHVIK